MDCLLKCSGSDRTYSISGTQLESALADLPNADRANIRGNAAFKCAYCGCIFSGTTIIRWNDIVHFSPEKKAEREKMMALEKVAAENIAPSEQK